MSYSPQYPRAFIALQITFARKIAEILEQPLTAVLIDYTLLRQIFYLRVSHKLANPLWDEFLHGLDTHDDPVEWAYQFHLRRANASPEQSSHQPQHFGCFSYAYPWHATPCLYLHFESRDRSGFGALSKRRMAARKAELADLFHHAKTSHPDAKTVRSNSWLYNIEAYCRLFPPDFLATAKPISHEPGFWTTWGQFIHRQGQLNELMAKQFLECLREQTTVEGCLRCFPYPRLTLVSPIQHFYEFYGVKARPNIRNKE
jgi:hypothetical protein